VKEVGGERDDDSFSHYILVHSKPHSDFEHATESIEKTVHTEFSTTNVDELKSIFASWADNPDKEDLVDPECFLVLDEQSARDHKVLIIQDSEEWIMSEGREWFPLPDDTRKDLRKVKVCTTHRVPFKKVEYVVAGLEGSCEPTEDYIIDVKKIVGDKVGSYRVLEKGWEDVEGY
jgi:hypothetical protein